MAKFQACAECRQQGIVGADVVPYVVAGRKGQNITRWLHPLCQPPWNARYLEWLKGGADRDPGDAATKSLASMRKTLEAP